MAQRQRLNREEKSIDSFLDHRFPIFYAFGSKILNGSIIEVVKTARRLREFKKIHENGQKHA